MLLIYLTREKENETHFRCRLWIGMEFRRKNTNFSLSLIKLSVFSKIPNSWTPPTELHWYSQSSSTNLWEFLLELEIWKLSENFLCWENFLREGRVSVCYPNKPERKNIFFSLCRKTTQVRENDRGLRPRSDNSQQLLGVFLFYLFYLFIKLKLILI